MTFPSSGASPDDSNPRKAKTGDTFEQVSWWSFHTTASLLLNYHMKLEVVHQMRDEIVYGDLTKDRIDLRARQVQAEVDDVTAIVAELRKRGHSVEWEE